MNRPGTSASSVCQGNIYFFFSLFGKMDLALHQSLGVCSLHVVPKTTACFSFSVSRSPSICYYALCCVEKAPVCLICYGCQGLGEMCFQLPLGRMTDGKTIKHRTWAQCVCARAHVCVCVHPHATATFECVQACPCMLLCALLCVHEGMCVSMRSALWFFSYSFIQHCWVSKEIVTIVKEIIEYSSQKQ